MIVNLVENCPSCEILGALEHPRVLYITDYFVITLAQPAYNTGHVWLIAKAHGLTFAQLSKVACHQLQLLTERVTNALEKICAPQHFTVGFKQTGSAPAGAGQHFYLELVPRWQGDANFMFTGGKIRTLGIDLQNLQKQLQEELHAQ